MKILIIGGGAVGSIAAKFLTESNDVEQVVLGDINPQKAKKFIIPHPKITLKTIDARDVAALTEAAKGMDLIMNASLSFFNENLIKAALAAGTHYQDFSSDTWQIEQLKHHQDFKKNGKIALVNASAAPGVTNLLAAELANGLKRIEYVKIRLLEDVSSEVPFTAWAKAIFFDQIYTKPVVWEFDKLVTRNNFSEEEIYNFPEPHLNEKCYLIPQEEISTIPKYIKTKYADLKIGGSEMDLARTLFKLGLFKKAPIKIGEAMLTPYDFLLKIWPDVISPDNMKKLVKSGKLHNAKFWATIEEQGIHDKKRTSRKAVILFPDQTAVNTLYPGANYVSYSAGLCAAIFALAIPKIKDTGAFPPEAIKADIRKEIIDALRAHSVKIDITETA